MEHIPSTFLVMGAAFVIGAVMGIAILRSNYCVLGAVSDWVNMGDSQRLRAWLLAVAVAIAGVGMLSLGGFIDVTASRIPYASDTFAWTRHLLGGLMFGVGMTLSSGCSSKNIVRAASGSGKALVVLLVASTSAYLMMKTPFYGWTFHRLLQPLEIELATVGLPDQRLGTVVATVLDADAGRVNALLGIVLGGMLSALAWRSAPFRRNHGLWAAGLVVGAAVVAGWAITAGPLGRHWLEDAEFMLVTPTAVGVQSFTFISPLGNAVAFAIGPVRAGLVTFGMCAVAGVFTGALVDGLARRRWRWEWFPSWRDFWRNVSGGVLLGVGGVLALGCTIGQGVTGLSTLAVGSVLASGATILGSALAMRIELYRLVYATEAGMAAALLSALVDVRLLPSRYRRLDHV